MVGYQIYLKYINSGVAWMGNVPDHWVPIRFKHRLLEKKKVSNPGLDAGSISFGRVIFKVTENLAPETKASYQEVLAGEFLINPLNMNYDLLSLRTALSAIDVVVSTGYIVIRSEDDLVKRYVRWLLQAFDVAHMKTLGSGVRQTINYMDIGNSFFYEPPKDEQQTIANFLDHETAKIDTLIDKQQQLITLLKEKRQAVISHAVTKGLNPNTPMRDSGVEWLGEVPEHWKVLKIQRVLESIEQGSSPVASNVPPKLGEAGVLKISAVKSGTFHGHLAKTLIEFDYEERFQIHRDNLLVTRGNTPELVADACVVKAEPNTRLMMSDLIYRLNTRPEMKERYLCYWLLSSCGRLQIQNDARGSSMTMAKVSQGHIKSWLTTLPQLDEQDAIVAVMESRERKLDALLSNCQLMIEQLKERRTALISAAVTGKIDVRNWHASATTNNHKEVAP